jgi:hypothetical protein
LKAGWLILGFQKRKFCSALNDLRQNYKLGNEFEISTKCPSPNWRLAAKRVGRGDDHRQGDSRRFRKTSILSTELWFYLKYDWGPILAAARCHQQVALPVHPCCCKTLHYRSCFN